MEGRFVVSKKTAGCVLSLIFLLTACTPSPVAPRQVGKSLYLNKRYMKFEVDNGPSYRDVRLPDGSVMHYWRSDYGNLIAAALGRDDSYPDYCELVLRTDKNGIVREITVLEESIICGGVLK